MTGSDIDGLERRRSGNSFTGDVWTNLRRWNRKTLRNPFVVVVALVQPIVALLLFTEIFGAVGAAALAESTFSSVDYVTFLLPAVVIQASLASAIASGVGLFDDIQSGMFEKALVTPMTPIAMFAGKAASELFRVIVQVLVVLGLGVAIGGTIETGVAGGIGIVVICLLFALWFMAVSNAIALLTTNEEAIIAVANLLQFPLLFLSSGLLPVETLPSWVRMIAALNPVTYGVDAVRALVVGRDTLTVTTVNQFGGIYDTLVPAVGVLVLINVLCGGITVSLISRTRGGV